MGQTIFCALASDRPYRFRSVQLQLALLHLNNFAPALTCKTQNLECAANRNRGGQIELCLPPDPMVHNDFAIGIHEVRGSIPLGSTNKNKHLTEMHDDGLTNCLPAVTRN